MDWLLWPFQEENGVLQKPWEAINQYKVVQHWLFPGHVSVVTWFLICFYFMWKDVMRHESKIQKDYWPSYQDMWDAAWPQIVIYCGLDFVATYLFRDLVQLPANAPSLFRFIWEISVSLVLGDFLIYWSHRTMHKFTYLRTKIHSVHHLYHAPFGWAGGVVHPLEDMIVVLCQITIPLLFKFHPLSFWTFICVWVIFLIEEHSGHDVWFAPYNFLPFTQTPLGGGAAPHDIHHYLPQVNFSFVFCIWDQIFKTYTPVIDPPIKPDYYKDWWEWKKKEK